MQKMYFYNELYNELKLNISINFLTNSFQIIIHLFKCRRKPMPLLISLLTTMTACGTIPFLIYFVLTRLFDSSICAALRYRILKLCLIFYLIPFPLFKHLILRLTSPNAPDNLPADGTPIYLDQTIVQDGNHFFLASIPDAHKALLAVWMILVSSLMIHQLYLYFRFRKQMNLTCTPYTKYHALMKELCSNLHISRKISILFSDSEASPYTCGFFRPVIVLTHAVPKSGIKIVLLHELHHIKSHDFFIRLLGMTAVLVHVYNPFIFLFWKELKNIQELNCDESLIKSLPPKTQNLYGHMLIDMTAIPIRSAQPAIYFFKYNKRSLNNRIIKIKTPIKNRRWLAPAFFCLMLVASSIPAAAYSPPTIHLKNWSSFHKKLAQSDWISIAYKDTAGSDIPDIPIDEFAFQYTDDYLMLEDNTILPHTQKHMMPDRIAKDCHHHYATGLEKRHSKCNGTSCIVSFYTVKYCKQCHTIVSKVLTNEVTCKPCRHEPASATF